LIAGGEVEDVVVEVEPLEDGVAVLVRAEVASRVSRVQIDGVSRALTRRLRSNLNLRIGQPVRITQLEADLDRATQVLRDQGYPEANLGRPSFISTAPVSTSPSQSPGQPLI
jgi:outer membrane protein assembly factor BamA